MESAKQLLIRPVEAVPLTGFSRAMIYKLLAAGELPSVRVGRSVRIPMAALQRWIEANTIGGVQ